MTRPQISQQTPAPGSDTARSSLSRQNSISLVSREPTLWRTSPCAVWMQTAVF